ncbi:vWA domain-containing protein [Clostridium hydrogenum]|uniref:vWA domain-containing protein n=1 Tax=Clostridium hydrogenum TaxID=2855764 RepID=UPI001F1DD204|nr:vWA domain-containing protein [Clostridium hydrogenum]
MKLKINWLMVLMSAVGGTLAFIIGEVLMDYFKYSMPHSLLMGMYFGILSLLVGLMCLLAEVAYPKINGLNWRRDYISLSFKFLIPCTLIVTLVAGTLFQFLYELSFKKSSKVINDVVLLIDTSGSMSKTDPNNERFDAVNDLLNSMNSTNRVSVYTFDDHTTKIKVMSYVDNSVKDDITNELQKYKNPSGNTNMREALDSAYDEINKSEGKGRNAMVIMLSDGGDNYDLDKKFDKTMEPYNYAGIPVYTIGMSDGDNFYMLKKIAQASGGDYYNVKDVKNIKNTFVKIYRDRQGRLLNDKRNGIYGDSTFYGCLRVIFITLISILISAAVSFVLDNKYLLKGFIIGGAIGGIIAGLILEIGFNTVSWHGSLYRALADLAMAVVFTLFAREYYDEKGGKKSFSKKRVVETSKNSFDKDVKGSRHSFR